MTAPAAPAAGADAALLLWGTAVAAAAAADSACIESSACAFTWAGPLARGEAFGRLLLQLLNEAPQPPPAPLETPLPGA